MAKGQYLSAYQQGIVRRFYSHRDTVLSSRLAELVSELYLAEGKAADKLWKRAEETMLKAGADAADVAKIVTPRDVAALAQVAGELSTGRGAKKASPPKKEADPDW